MSKPKKQKKEDGIRDRIKELRRVPASELIRNPGNWRKHPEAQKEVIRGLLSEIGYADALIARETEDGLLLLDGHLRADTTPDQIVPVLVLDVNEEEGKKILATLDPVAAMAEADAVALDALLRDVQTGNQAIADMLTELSTHSESVANGGSSDPNSESKQEDEKYTRKVEAPIYRPTGPKPSISDLFDRSKADLLIAEIDKQDIPEGDKEFLRLAAMRHVVFDYEKIAEYYAQSPDEVKEQFESSALVIIDFNKAIELGYVKLSERLAELYGEEYPDE